MSSFQAVNPADVKDGYHIPSGRKVLNYEGKSVISNTGYGWDPAINGNRAGSIKPDPYDPNAAKPRSTQYSPRPQSAINSSMVSDSDYVIPKGQFRGPGQRQKSDGQGGWIDVNKVHASQPAVLNGKHVRADGKGNWLDSSGSKVGTYKVGEDRQPKPIPKVIREKPPVPEVDLDKPPVPEVDPGKPPVPEVDPGNKNGNGRGTQKINANGVEQTGTQMSTLGDFNKMYERVVGKHNMSATAYNPFESVHLHTKGDNRDDMVNDGPNSYSSDEAAAFNSGQGIEWSSDQKADAPYTIAKPADVTSTEGAPKIVQSGAGKVVKGVNGHEFGGDHEAPATRKRDRTSQLREKWMLGDMKDKDGNDLSSIQRLRGMRMEQGFDRQGDKFYARASLDPANESKPTEISQDQYRQAVVSDAGAQQVAADLKDAYTSRIKDEANTETTAPILPTQAEMEDFGTSMGQYLSTLKKPTAK